MPRTPESPKAQAPTIAYVKAVQERVANLEDTMLNLQVIVDGWYDRPEATKLQEAIMLHADRARSELAKLADALRHELAAPKGA